MIRHVSIVRRTRVAVASVVLLALVQGQGCPELDNLPFDIEQLIGSLGLEGGPFQDRNRCERDCEEDADLLLEECLAGLPDDAGDDEREACEGEAADQRDTCKADCPPDEDDRGHERDCERACVEESDRVFDDCVAGLGEDATDEDFDACEIEAEEFRHGCKEDCRRDDDDDDDHEGDCKYACVEESDWFYEDCVAGLGEDATEEDFEACEDEAEDFRHDCKEDCRRDDDDDHGDDCEYACGDESEWVFNDCVERLGGEDVTDEDLQICEEEAEAFRLGCKEDCAWDNDDDDECEEACVEVADSAFETCFEERTADAVEVCEVEADDDLAACKDACPADDVDCEEACVEDSDSVFDDCFEGFNDEALDVCEAEADELRDTCKDDCESDDGDHDDDDEEEDEDDD